MPADPSIYGTIRPYQGPADPLQQYGTMMQLRAMGDQSALSDLQRRKLEQDFAEEEAFKSKIAGWANAGGQGAVSPDVWAASPQRAASFEKTRLEGAKTQSEIDKNKLEIHGKQVQQLRDSLAAANDDAALTRVRDEATRLYGPSAAASMPASVSAPGFADWKKSQLMTADKLIEQMTPKIEKVDLGGKIVPIDFNPVTNPAIKTAEFKKSLGPQAPQLVQDANGNYQWAQPPAAAGLGPAAAPKPAAALAAASAPAPQPAAGVTPAGIEGSNSPNAAYRKGAAENMAKYESGLNERVQQGSDLMMRIAESREALTKFRAGGGAEGFMQAAKYAQGLGMPQAIVDKIAGGNLAAMEEFQKLAVQQAMEQLKQSMGGQGRIAQQEFKVFQANNPSIDTDPRAIEKVYAFSERVFKRDREEQQALSEYKKKPGADITEFPNHWQGRMADAGTTTPRPAEQRPSRADIDAELRRRKVIK